MLGQSFKTDRYEVEFSKEVNYESIKDLCNQIDMAVDYYQYRFIVIKINSLGGSLQALKHFQWHLKKWRAKGARFETVGNLVVASAAALMLSLGDFGYRYCYPHTQLLFHYARLPDVNNMTSQKSRYINQMLSEADKELLTEVSQHIVGNLDKDSYPLAPLKLGRSSFKPKTNLNESAKKRVVKKDLDRLFSMDRNISPNDAKQFLLIDEVL